jgi:hypothetical protein|nr:MAG TPA: hypothetical protein [Caudoviricetes sp.]DAJ44733.1 MAG TPA: hypothetical protein [Caudoviricetes sp.]DAR92101.1 MAG TPA: hypothetical protein [Caudoviricetes sp.]
MKNKEKYDLRDISYDLEVDRGGYDFVIYYTSMEIYREFFSGSVSTCSTFTKWLEEEYKPNILEEKEKEYLAAVIKPFREKVKYIQKCFDLGNEAYIYIYVKKCGSMIFPTFRRGTMYKGMEVNKRYTLEDLGL